MVLCISRFADHAKQNSVYSVCCFPLTSSDSDFQFCVKIIFGNNIEVDPYRIYACIAPVGGHTCLTAGERSEPAD